MTDRMVQADAEILRLHDEVDELRAEVARLRQVIEGTATIIGTYEHATRSSLRPVIRKLNNALKEQDND